MEPNFLNTSCLKNRNARLQICEHEKASSSSLQSNFSMRLESLDFYDVIKRIILTFSTTIFLFRYKRKIILNYILRMSHVIKLP